MSQFEFPEWMGKNPRANSPWTKEEVKHLTTSFTYGMSVKMLARMHGRNEGGIMSRLYSALGVENVQRILEARLPRPQQELFRDNSRSMCFGACPGDVFVPAGMAIAAGIFPAMTDRDGYVYQEIPECEVPREWKIGARRDQKFFRRVKIETERGVDPKVLVEISKCVDSLKEIIDAHCKSAS